MDIFEIANAPVRLLPEHNSVTATGIAPVGELEWGLGNQDVIRLIRQAGVLKEGDALLVVGSLQILVMTLFRDFNEALPGIRIPSGVEANIAFVEVHGGIDLP